MNQVSIIIPAHNEKENLTRLLPILGNLPTSCQVEIIVALSKDNNDGSENLVSMDNIKFIRCFGKGRAVQMNTGFSKSKGNVLVFLHADVLPPNSFLIDIMDTLKAGYDAGFFSYRFDKENPWLNINPSFTARDGIFTGGGDQCLFIKRNVFNALKTFDENQVIMEDFEFFKRMKKESVSYKIVKSDLIVSSRKYNNNSYLRVNLSNLLLIILFRCGCPSKRLKELHDRLIRAPHGNDISSFNN
ncbi:glycosyltransferase [Pareuzebyella sediminis]|uniref:glycosyltransferase n=1 Tax=Pareuzebyella sediminis TaxID=2607998 RepID=UPI0011EDD8D6|nr:glycosyltransferase [Pareuzebyella sediminis]